ncbi:uncharacterized protein DUF3225 [Motilibacter rhizosphaerae]|uniref:Uncharacterized protein DUF3225 n=1 Tax=Motilibacter rhizosphaerae TaxID=598652 RepID=A0A4Q7NST8_9ACTN|nr:oxalurate catabolism protein HpxZ [Motilibacter rhizosphaerae]RZS90105.1 uncharacterized protein DUF3225 [Motilibacter rhizosphaerae]
MTAGATEQLELDRPDVVAEVRAAFTAYEQALVDHDVPAMTAAFWDSPSCVRYGVAERLYGAAEIERWRTGATPVGRDRRLGPTVVATFGTAYAVVSTEFRYASQPGAVGRQSQTWVKLAGTWQVVAAHVSVQPEDEQPDG